ncbi:MAG: TRAP transporter large permease [Alphaproteobacteria bacterium]|nr:TRAP transporter large permease [Alphaproteobacteria bacterium]
MEAFEIALVSVGAMLVLIYLGLHIATTLALISFIGVWVIKGNTTIALNLLWVSAYDTVNSYVFASIPTFVLMGFLVAAAGMGRDAYDIGQFLLRRLLGGLGMATVVANAIFAAITGVSVASASVFSKLSVPEMLRHGYTARFAVGTVAGSSVLGMLIPPSVLFIVYALITEQSVGAMFVAGIGPGILLTVLFCGQIYIMARWFPNLVFARGVPPAHSTAPDDADKGGAEGGAGALLRKAGPITLLVVLVLGGLYGGVFTPVEAGAAGAFLGLIFALVRRSLTWRGFWDVLLETGSVTATLLFLIVAASMYSRMLGLSGLPSELAAMFEASGFGFYGLLSIYVAIVLVLGTIVDSISIMLIMVPLFLAAIKSFQIDLVWFGVVTVIATEVGLLTPPFGLAAYVVHSTLARPDISLKDIFIGAGPFALTMCLVVFLIVVYPPIATFLVTLRF